ncbi:hypothetical protein FEM48_Zijuj12G0165800 [Ziziphus jujuba var. spinosa]|uniref:Disease resistance protein At4g27190-like leucine-rich repeats domain-containing protein n=1 Tax=Ziziphus jujuba var. spinosa TaxID=714518 RepID=A0A978UEF4_ZIZJJ|nr:hypothetical protein FEM48_Zijuj12G0165800 [Ziziphus jujuba var. spinosa]
MEEWPEIDSSEMEHCTAISLVFNKGIKKHPDNLACPKLKLLKLKIFPFSSWSSLEGNEEKTSASLDEIIPRDLKVLNVQIPKMKFVPRNFPFKNLTRFEINVGTNYTYEDDYLFGNYLRLGEVSADSIKQSGIHPIVKKCEVLQLYEVYDLKNLFPHFDEEEQDGFPWLRTLEVGFCKEMEYVVKFTSNNNRTNLHVPNIFPLLEKLELYGLEGLKGIFHYNSDDLQLPPTDHQFVRKERISTASSLPRGFPQLQRLTELTLQNLPSLISLCRAIDDEGSTRRPKDADGVESNMDNMNTPTKILVPFKCIKWLPSLANLSVDSCDSIRTLFSFLGDDHDRQLDNQKEEWLKNLEELGVHWCNSLVVIFDIRWSRKADAHMEDGSTTAKLLVMLKSLKVANCRSMEEVVAKTEEKIKNVNAELYVVSFPHLVSIELDNLDNLYCFCQQPYTFEFSSLEILQIRECPKLQKFSTANKTLKTPELTDVELDDKYIEILEQDLNDTIRHYFETSQIFPFSSWSSLEGNEEKTSASLDEIIPRDVRVKKCEDLELDGVYDLKNLLPHFAEEEQDGFPWLRTLDVFNCNDMEYVVKFTSNNNRTDLHVPDIFPLLKGIFHYNSQEIINTSHLTKDIDHNHQVEEKWLKNLDKLEVGWCDSLEVVFDYGEGPLAPALNKLKSLRLYGLTNLMHIWKKGPQQVKTVCFQNLKTLSLYSCPSLRYLFTASIAKVLVMLESLQVTKCTSMEEVVARAEEEINNVNVESYVVSFSHLVSLNWIIWIISTVSVYNLMLLNSHP